MPFLSFESYILLQKGIYIIGIFCNKFWRNLWKTHLKLFTSITNQTLLDFLILWMMQNFTKFRTFTFMSATLHDRELWLPQLSHLPLYEMRWKLVRITILKQWLEESLKLEMYIRNLSSRRFLLNTILLKFLLLICWISLR